MSVLGAQLTQAVQRALGDAIAFARPLSGGDINEAFELELANGARVFMKTNRGAAAGMFAAEARGLAWLSAASALRVPRVVCVSNDEPDEPSFLVLELIRAAPRARGFDERLGRGLAALHRFGAPTFGLAHDNYIGTLPQSNSPHASWLEFFWRERLEPQRRRAASAGLVTRIMRAGFERLERELPQLVGPDEPPSRLHGDLWSQNVHVDEQGEPCLIDPAVYGGQREVDLAMMRLFGGFGEAVFHAYEEVWPLAPGHAERVALYQLYPLLVHVNLFGGSYVGSVERSLAPYL